MRKDSSDAQQVKENGWRQGSVIDPVTVPIPAPVPNGIEQAGLPDMGDDGLWVVISHDCDVTNASFGHEPIVELIFAARLSEGDQDGNLQWAKNTRSIQFEIGEAAYRSDIHQRVTVDRRLLSSLRPAEQTLSPETVRLLANWVSKRYRRAAFADEFNERVRKAASKIRDKGKKKGQWISGLYLLVSDDELPGEQPYQITLIGTAKQEVFDDPETRKLAMNFFNQIETVLAGCDGIEMIDAELRSEADVSIADLEHLKRWDYDDLTFRKGGTEAFPADDR